MNPKAKAFLVFVQLLWISCSLAQQCGSQAGDQVCQNGLCCSQYGYCGTTSDYCGTGCQSQCSGSPAPSGGGVSSIITSSVFDNFLSHRSDGGNCANGFYTYDAFLTAAAAFSGFGTTGDTDTTKRELAAFFANVAHETTEGCYVEEIDKSNSYCDATNTQWPCASGQSYYGRGPLQISWNYNYGPAGQAIDFDGLGNPGVVATDPVISFKTAVWFWMTGTTSCHTAITSGQGFGQTIKIINGGIECGDTSNSSQQDRISLYQSFCATLGVQPGDNLTC